MGSVEVATSSTPNGVIGAVATVATRLIGQGRELHIDAHAVDSGLEVQRLSRAHHRCDLRRVSLPRRPFNVRVEGADALFDDLQLR